MSDPDLKSQLMVVAAHRYCLGRRTYMVEACIAWLSENWGDIADGAQVTILKDTRAAVDADRAGDDVDRRQWEAFLKKHGEDG